LAAERAVVSAAHARMVDLLRRVDRMQLAVSDGCRSLAEWVAARLDVSAAVAADLVAVARAGDPEVDRWLAAGEVGLERAAALVRLGQAGGGAELVARSFGFDLAGVARLSASLRRFAPAAEGEVFAGRYLVVQPTLDQTGWKLWGRLAGTDGAVVDAALQARADSFPPVPGVTAAQRRADALVDLAAGSLGGGSEGRVVTAATVFVDGSLAARTGGEAGAAVAAGPRVGPNTLAEILCDGRVSVVALGGDRRPVGISQRGEVIPPAVRSYVLYRDGGCVIDGCRSRNRLQPHHIRERAAGGDHDPDNIATLCWYHHHVAVHGMGLLLDPHSPPQRRRLHTPPRAGP
jgi:hypothetical protein